MVFIPLYINDPLQIFHKDYNGKTTLSINMRQQAAGLLKNFNYDSIILGTSMLANTSSKEASDILGGSFLNISIFGGDFYERGIILKKALKQKNIKQVIYSLDDNYLTLSKAQTLGFEYLYDDNLINDFKIYLNKKYLLECFLGFSHKSECSGKEVDIYRPTAWYKESRYTCHFGGLQNWFKNQENQLAYTHYKTIADIARKIKDGKKKRIKGVLKQHLEQTFRYIDSNLLSIVKQYQDTKFILVFPPYSRIVYARWAQYDIDLYTIHKAVLRYFSAKSDIYKNLEVYAWGGEDFLDDIKNYKDPTHYHHKINTYMLESIRDKKALLNKDNIDKYIKTIDNKNLNYNLIKIGKEIDSFLTSISNQTMYNTKK
jgi:hypothetical protein